MDERQKIIDLFDKVRNQVLEVSCYEELISEIEKMQGSSMSDIIAKLNLIVATKRVSDYGKRRLYSFILDIKSFNEKELELFAIVARVELVESQKEEIERKIEMLLKLMDDSCDDTWEPYIRLATYYEDLNRSRYEFMKDLNELIARNTEQKQEGKVVDIDINTIFETLKKSGLTGENKNFNNSKVQEDDLPGSSGRLQ